MPNPLRSDAYPPQYRRILALVFDKGEFFIPHDKPSALRFSFYGYLKALREEGQSTYADSFALFIKHAPEPGVRIILKEQTNIAQALERALLAAGEAPTTDAANAFLDNLPGD